MYAESYSSMQNSRQKELETNRLKTTKFINDNHNFDICFSAPYYSNERDIYMINIDGGTVHKLTSREQHPSVEKIDI